MATVIDLLRQLGYGAAPGGGNALGGPVELPAKALPVFSAPLPRPLTSAWYRLTGRALAAHHALALAASRTMEPMCLVGPAAATGDDLLLLVAAQLLADPAAVALWLVPDQATARWSSERIDRLFSLLDLPWRPVSDSAGRQAAPRLVVATYDELHGRLLRFADRGWSWLWKRLGIVALPELHHAAGSWGNHLAWLIRRSSRLAALKPRLLCASGSVTAAADRAAALLGQPCRVIKAEVSRPDSTLIALWRCVDRQTGLATLAGELHGRGLAVTIIGRDFLETEHLRRSFAADMAVGWEPGEARVALVAGVPRAAADRESLFNRGYRLLVMMAAGEPHEYLFAAEPERLLDALPVQPLTLLNPYVAARHLQSAAGELPIDRAEIDRWSMEDLAGRLVARGLLRAVGASFHPGDRTVEPAGDLLAATWNDRPTDVRDPRGGVIARLSPAVADWLGLPGTTWSADLAVASRSEDPPGVDLALDERRLALPDMTVALNIRETVERRQAKLGRQTLTVLRAKIEAQQRVEGLLVYGKVDTPAALRLGQPLESAWTALACGIVLPTAPPDPRTAGWSLTQALPLVILSRPGELIPSYDPATRTLWFVETEPGGAGISEAVAHNIEGLLGMARVVSRALEQSDRYAPLARSERTWLEALYDVGVARTEQPRPPLPAQAEVHEEATPALPIELEAHEKAAPVLPTELEVHEEAAPALDFPRRTRIYRAVDPPPAIVAAETTPPEWVDEPVVDTSAAQAEDLPPHDQLSVDLGLNELDLPTAAAEEQLLDELVTASATSEPLAATSGPLAATPADEAEDITWQDQPVSAYDSVDEISWASERLPAVIDDIAWAPEGDEQVPDEAAEPVQLEVDLPALGHESTAGLNTPRQPGRYAAAGERSAPRGGLLKRSPGAQTYESPRSARPPPGSAPPPSRLEPPRDEGAAPELAYQRVEDRSPAPDPTPPRSSERPSWAGRGEPVEEAGSRAAERSVDVGGMIARMRRLRAERERTQATAAPPPIPKPAGDDEDVPLRFRAGQRVTCVPYGEGVVRAARIASGREQLTIEFPGEGRIEVDPGVNAVRVLEDAGDEGQDDDEPA